MLWCNPDDHFKWEKKTLFTSYSATLHSFTLFFFHIKFIYVLVSGNSKLLSNSLKTWNCLSEPHRRIKRLTNVHLIHVNELLYLSLVFYFLWIYLFILCLAYVAKCLTDAKLIPKRTNSTANGQHKTANKINFSFVVTREVHSNATRKSRYSSNCTLSELAASRRNEDLKQKQ